MFRKPAIVTLVFFLALLMSSACVAEEETVKKANPLDKLGNGIMNILTGWMEIPRHISDSFEKKTPGSLVQDGLINGVASALFRTAAGVIDTVTFFIPPYDKALMEPLYKE
ncbi:MAG: exosortase system-associated protein, TIGR04073 family [Candidatus Omnitrophica bacterium]|nr:exosortase system-associated protein, TIGR04073 family [Candidatus Omnitrophota bacterium]